MTQESTQNAARSVLSWESVVDVEDPPEETSVEAPPESARPAPEPAASPAAPAAPAPLNPGIAPLSLDPLSLDPLPPIAAGATPARDSAPVLGEFHLDLVPISATADDDSSSTAPPAAAPAARPDVSAEPESEPLFAGFDLKLAPFDVVDIAPSTSSSVTGNDTGEGNGIGDDLRISALDAALGASRPIRSAAPDSRPADVTPSAVVPQPEVAPPAPAPAAASTPQHVPPPPHAPQADPAAAPSHPVLPTHDVAVDATPTTTITTAHTAEAAVDTAIAAARNAAAMAHVALPQIAAPQTAPPQIKLPDHQPNQAALQRLPHGIDVPEEPAAPRRKKKKQQKPPKQHQQSSGAGGIALFFTLLVLVGLIVGAIIYGRPFLFPEEPPTATESDVVAPLSVVRQSDEVFAASMADHLLGDWESMLPLWRSFGLANGAVDTAVVQQLLAGWTDAFYSPDLGVVVARDSVESKKLDGAIAEAMAIGALDQTVNWSADLTEGALDANALRRAEMIAASRAASSATAFGSADNADRPIGPAAFLPPVLAYEVGAPIAFAEFAPVDVAREGSLLIPAAMPELLEGDTIIASEQLMDRTFWYLVFASYNDASSAYAASNALVQSSVATADRAGTQCTYATFSGTDVAGTAQVGAVLGNWVATVPPAMQASFQTLPDGTMQLSTCDPGAGFETEARFGVAREMTRWRSVELAALETVDPVTGTPADRVAAVTGVRTSQVGLSLMEWPFDTPYDVSAVEARALVGIVEAPAVETAVPAGDAPVGEAPLDQAPVDEAPGG